MSFSDSLQLGILPMTHLMHLQKVNKIQESKLLPVLITGMSNLLKTD